MNFNNNNNKFLISLNAKIILPLSESLTSMEYP